MPHLSEFTEYKKNVASLILNDSKSVELITGEKDTALPAASLINDQLFLYDYVDSTVEDAKTYVCIEVDEADVKSAAVSGIMLYVYIIVHKSLMNMSGEIRRDALCQRIDVLLNGNHDFGFGKLERRPGGRFSVNDSFRGRSLCYYVLDWNRFNTTLNGTSSK
ncbi:MAG: hypothetical protein PHX74_06520 [Candidatus Sumerlaeales bacterium]|nr:hypothetical protein [Candidatus Sumerlaeales bacterium]